MSSADAITLPVKVLFPSSIFLVFSGEKYDRIIPTKNTMSVRSIITLGNSKMKNFIASVR